MRAISSSSSTTAPVASAQPQQHQNQDPAEVDEEKHGGLEKEAKFSLPVRAYFFSTRYYFSPFFPKCCLMCEGDAVYVMMGIRIGLGI